MFRFDIGLGNHSTALVRQHNAQYWPDPKCSDIVFFSADYISM